jgi:LPS export ABC transporter protein LptC
MNLKLIYENIKIKLNPLLNKFSKRQWVYILLAIILVITILWAFISATIITTGFNRDQLIGRENAKELDIDGIILTETKDGVKYWEIYGDTGTYNSDNKVALLEGVTGNFYKGNEVSMSFESSQGTYNEDKKEIILYKNTFIALKDGTTLNCDRLIWSGSDKNIIGQGNVKINRNSELISTANEVIISPDYTHFKIKGNAVSKLFDLKEKK